MILYNCSAYRNKGNNYSVSGTLATGKILVSKAVENKFNSWFYRDDIMLKLNSPANRPLRYSLYRLNGQLAYRSEIITPAPLQKLNCIYLSPGVYILKISTGTTSWKPQKLVKLN